MKEETLMKTYLLHSQTFFIKLFEDRGIYICIEKRIRNEASIVSFRATHMKSVLTLCTRKREKGTKQIVSFNMNIYLSKLVLLEGFNHITKSF